MFTEKHIARKLRKFSNLDDTASANLIHHVFNSGLRQTMCSGHSECVGCPNLSCTFLTPPGERVGRASTRQANSSALNLPAAVPSFSLCVVNLVVVFLAVNSVWGRTSLQLTHKSIELQPRAERYLRAAAMRVSSNLSLASLPNFLTNLRVEETGTADDVRNDGVPLSKIFPLRMINIKSMRIPSFLQNRTLS